MYSYLSLQRLSNELSSCHFVHDCAGRASTATLQQHCHKPEAATRPQRAQLRLLWFASEPLSRGLRFASGPGSSAPLLPLPSYKPITGAAACDLMRSQRTNVLFLFLYYFILPMVQMQIQLCRRNIIRFNLVISN